MVGVASVLLSMCLYACMSPLLAMYLHTFYAQQNSYFVCTWSGGREGGGGGGGGQPQVFWA